MHIGFGQNTVSSLYGHQKGDYMKTIGFSHKKHKANESQEKMTVTSGKDVCRKIGHSDEVDGENQENTYIHDSFALDASYANYIRETVPKTVWSNDYLRELWDENAKYLKSIRESKNGYGFDDIGMGAAYAYSTMYQKIVEGYRNGTREVYVCDNPESGKRRLLSMDEELEKLNKGFEELIKWDKMVAKSQKQNAENKQKFQNTKLDESFDAFDINQAYGVVAAILFLAAALVIYSIFYISVGQKVAEFGQLRTIGASKKQIYKIVLKQGYMLAVPGILIGSIMGTIISYCLQSKGWSVFAFIVSLCGACLFGILLVYISVRKPAKIAANFLCKC